MQIRGYDVDAARTSIPAIVTANENVRDVVQLSAFVPFWVWSDGESRSTGEMWIMLKSPVEPHVRKAGLACCSQRKVNADRRLAKLWCSMPKRFPRFLRNDYLILQLILCRPCVTSSWTVARSVRANTMFSRRAGWKTSGAPMSRRRVSPIPVS